MHTKGLGTGVMVFAMVSRCFGSEIEMTKDQMLEIKKKREGTSYTDVESVT